MSDVDADPKVIELTQKLKDAEDAIATENREFDQAQSEGLEEGAGSYHDAQLDRLESDRKWIANSLARQRRIVEEAVGAAANVDPEMLSDEIQKARERSELANVDLHHAHAEDTHEQLEHDRDLADARLAVLIRRQDDLAAQTIPGETGHYDDSHAFGWTKPPDNLDTGHYDDGHSFGWGTKKKAIVAGGIVAAILAIVAGAIALTRDSGGGTTPAAAGAGSTSSASQPSSSSLDVAALPNNTVLAGCIAIDPQGNTTILHPGFLVANPQPGDYTATFATGPTGTVRGTGTANGNLVVTDVTITAFGTYDGLTLTGPGGDAIATGPIAAQLPLEINAQTDKPNGCDPHALQMPSAAPQPGGGAQAAIVNFLSQFSAASQKTDVGFLVDALDPAVIARYGREQCTADLSRVAADPTANLTFKAITSGPEPYTYTTDAQSTIVPDTYTVTVSRTANGNTTENSLHFSMDAAGNVHWFTDCTH